VGNFVDYWEIIDSYDNLQGGFIWDWVDQGLLTTTESGDTIFGYGGDFGPPGTPSDGNFLINGIVMPDRRLNPSALEVKKVYQYVDVVPANLEDGVVTIENRHDFADLDDLMLVWAVVADGVVQQTGELVALDIAAGERREMRIPFRRFQPSPGTEYYLNLSFRTRRQRGLLMAGHEVAFEQLRLPFSAPVAARPIDSLPALQVEDGEETVTVTGPRFSVTLDRNTGVISSYTYDGTELILGGPEPNFWRAPTDNDFGGRWQRRLNVWKDPGATRTVRTVAVVRAGPPEVRIRTWARLEAGRSTYSTLYTILGNGEITVENHFVPRDEGLPRMPRFGMQMTLPREFSHIQWYGRGPHESYWDRKAGASVGLYEGTVAEQFHPYVRPQETGNKTDVRWMALTNDAGTGLLVVGMPLLSAGALHYTIDDLDPGEQKQQRHAGELVERDLVSLNIDHRQMGVGGVNSWGTTGLSNYSLYYQEYQYTFKLRPFSAEDGSPDALAKERYERE
jgi:beta-galactosidase